ncbi:SecA, preprotein cross-linking domain superfamily [Sesbania bispinosa]|nr:SecA, preprotein cross-linking domain superfamily [Sesbania bispinosa]
MEQLVNRLDLAMFNGILRESDEEMLTDPLSDPISDSKVLPIPAGKLGFGATAQLKNAGRRFSDGLKQAVEAKEGLPIQNKTDTRFY